MFIVDGVSYLSIKVLAAAAGILHNSLVPLSRRGDCSEVWEHSRGGIVVCAERNQGGLCCLVVGYIAGWRRAAGGHHP